MTSNGDQEPIGTQLSATTIDLAIRLGFIGLLGYWSFRVIAPYLTIGLWSAILAVALHPLFDWLAARLNARLAAALVTLLGLIVVVGPVTWLGLSMVSGTRSLVAALEGGQFVILPPPESVKGWPLVGERLHQLWGLAATNTSVALTEMLPMLKPLAATLLGMAQRALQGLGELVLSIVIAGFLFSRGPQLVDALSAFLSRVMSRHGKGLVQLGGATIRNVSRGVVGVAFLQALLAGVGFLAAGIPAPGVLAFLTFLLSVVQIGPTILFIPIVIWSWTALETAHALVFTGYIVVVGTMDNFLRPLLMARGLATPMPVIVVGVIGGALAYGIVGLFFGPIVLSVAWAVMQAWIKGGGSSVVGQA